MNEQIAALQTQYDQERAALPAGEDIEALQARYLGRGGLIDQVACSLPGLTADDRRTLGGQINALVAHIQGAR